MLTIFVIEMFSCFWVLNQVLLLDGKGWDIDFHWGGGAIAVYSPFAYFFHLIGDNLLLVSVLFQGKWKLGLVVYFASSIYFFLKIWNDRILLKSAFLADNLNFLDKFFLWVSFRNVLNILKVIFNHGVHHGHLLLIFHYLFHLLQFLNLKNSGLYFPLLI